MKTLKNPISSAPVLCLSLFASSLNAFAAQSDAAELVKTISCLKNSDDQQLSIVIELNESLGTFSYIAKNVSDSEVLFSESSNVACNPIFGGNFIWTTSGEESLTVKGSSIGVCRVTNATQFSLKLLKKWNSSVYTLEEFSSGSYWGSSAAPEIVEKPVAFLKGAVCAVTQSTL